MRCFFTILMALILVFERISMIGAHSKLYRSISKTFNKVFFCFYNCWTRNLVWAVYKYQKYSNANSIIHIHWYKLGLMFHDPHLILCKVKKCTPNIYFVNVSVWNWTQTLYNIIKKSIRIVEQMRKKHCLVLNII